jgi:hypothetical protein
MKLIIDIDDKDYEKLKDGYIPFRILDVIQNGIPLEQMRSEIEEFADKLTDIQDAYEQAKEDVYQEAMYKEGNISKLEGMLYAVEMIGQRLDKVIWKD